MLVQNMTKIESLPQICIVPNPIVFNLFWHVKVDVEMFLVVKLVIRYNDDSIYNIDKEMTIEFILSMQNNQIEKFC